MAPKTKPDSTVMYLYLCLKHSAGGTNVDFAAVAEATNLNVSAARMRFYRLKKVLDPQIVNGKVDLTKSSSGDMTDGDSSAVPTPAVTPNAKTGSKRRKIDKLQAKAETKQEEEEETAMEE